jgi:hypothetical protein
VVAPRCRAARHPAARESRRLPTLLLQRGANTYLEYHHSFAFRKETVGNVQLPCGRRNLAKSDLIRASGATTPMDPGIAH